MTAAIGPHVAHPLCFADGAHGSAFAHRTGLDSPRGRVPVRDLGRWRCACGPEFAGGIECAPGVAADSTGMKRTALIAIFPKDPAGIFSGQRLEFFDGNFWS